MKNKKPHLNIVALAIRNPLVRLLPFVAVVLLLLLTTLPARADEFDTQIKELNDSIASSQAQISTLKKQQNTLNNKIASLNAEIGSINYQIQLNELKRQKVESEIKKVTLELAQKKEFLAENIRLIYKQSSITPLEMLFGSDSIGAFVDQMQYLESIKESVQKATVRIAELKNLLEDEKKQLVGLISAQEAQQSGLATARSEQAGLLATTQGQEAAYQQIVSASNKKLQGIYAERASRDAANGTSVNVGGTGGYPYYNADPSIPRCYQGYSDPWGYCYRQCTSYAAWRRRAIGRQPYPNYWGNAAQWTNHAAWDDTPEIGDIAVWPAYSQPGVGSAGHVAIVEAVNGNGTIDVSEYNWRPFEYTYRGNVPTSGLRFIH